MSDLRKEIEQAINRCSAENGSDTPDFILAEFMFRCLRAFDAATLERDQWHGRPGLRTTDPSNSVGRMT